MSLYNVYRCLAMCIDLLHCVLNVSTHKFDEHCHIYSVGVYICVCKLLHSRYICRHTENNRVYVYFDVTLNSRI